MRKVPIKNYVYFFLIIAITVIIVLYLSNMYLNKNKETSTFYNYANEITVKDLDVYITENPDTIVYLADKYNLEYYNFENHLKNVIEQKNIKENLIFINASTKVINKLNKDDIIKISIENLPAIITFVDGKIKDYIYVSNDLNIEDIINYEVFE